MSTVTITHRPTRVTIAMRGVQGRPGPAGTGEGEPVPGPPGDSAYALAVAEGFEGTLAEWLESLRGPAGVGAELEPIAYISSPTPELLRDALVTLGVMLPESPQAPANTSPPAVSGGGVPGDTISATPGTWTGSPTSYAYQWQHLDGTWADVPGATASTHTALTVGQYRVRVVATNAVGDSAPAYSTTVNIAPELQPPAATIDPVISGGTGEGATLTVSNGTWANGPTSYAYLWERLDGETWVAAGTTASITAGVPGTQYRATVTATNAAGSASATTAVRTVLGPVPVLVMAPSVSGDPTPDSPLTSNNGEWSGNPTSYSYQWQVWSGTAWGDIAGATAQTFTPTAVMRVRSLVTAHNAWGASTPAASNAIDVTQPSTGDLEWAGGFNMSRAGKFSQSTIEASNNYGQAWTGPIPPGSYFELQVNETQPNNRVGVWPFAGDAPADPGVWSTLGQANLPHAFGVSADGEWSNHAFFQGEWVITGTPNTSMQPARRWAFHLTEDRELFVWQVWPGGQSALYNAGSPVAVFPGTDPLHIGHTAGPGLGALIIAPEDHYGEAPEGAMPI